MKIRLRLRFVFVSRQLTSQPFVWRLFFLENLKKATMTLASATVAAAVALPGSPGSRVTHERKSHFFLYCWPTKKAEEEKNECEIDIRRNLWLMASTTGDCNAEQQQLETKHLRHYAAILLQIHQMVFRIRFDEYETMPMCGWKKKGAHCRLCLS